MGEQKANLELKQPQNEEKGGITPDMIAGATVTVGGREIRLVYDLRAQITIDSEIGMDWDELRDCINRLKKAKNTKIVVQCIRILGNRGLQKDGEQPDLTDDWLMDHISLKDMLAYKIAILGVLTAGWYMETDDSQEREIDLGLAELRKKNGDTD
jgi:hypothetical protein